MVYIRLKDILDESFQDYKKPSMLLVTCYCNWKCLLENNLPISICQNSSIYKQKEVKIFIDDIINRYKNNNITQAITVAGLEPMLQYDEIYNFIKTFRKDCDDDVIIYTGYYENEIEDKLKQLKDIKNIIVKFGRYIPRLPKKYDDVLGVWLASNNQYAIKIS